MIILNVIVHAKKTEVYLLFRNSFEYKLLYEQIKKYPNDKAEVPSHSPKVPPKTENRSSGFIINFSFHRNRIIIKPFLNLMSSSLPNFLIKNFNLLVLNISVERKLKSCYSFWNRTSIIIFIRIKCVNWGWVDHFNTRLRTSINS